jgi:hypothetical protein
MKKDDIVRHIKSLRANQPIKSKGISPTHKGSTFTEDAIRVTGSREFIDGVLSHLKPVLDLESETQDLKLVYTQSRKDGNLIDKWNFYAIPVAKVRNRDKELLDLMREQARITAEINPKAAKAFEAAIDSFLNN